MNSSSAVILTASGPGLILDGLEQVLDLSAHRGICLSQLVINQSPCLPHYPQVLLHLRTGVLKSPGEYG